MESQLVRLVIAAFIGFILTVCAVPDEPPNFSPVPAPSPENSPSSEITPSPAATQLVPPPYRLPRRMCPQPGKAPQAPPEGQGALNEGKRVGMLFAGMAATLQVFVAAYIIFKRRQIF